MLNRTRQDDKTTNYLKNLSGFLRLQKKKKWKEIHSLHCSLFLTDFVLRLLAALFAPPPSKCKWHTQSDCGPLRLECEVKLEKRKFVKEEYAIHGNRSLSLAYSFGFHNGFAIFAKFHRHPLSSCHSLSAALAQKNSKRKKHSTIYFAQGGEGNEEISRKDVF